MRIDTSQATQRSDSIFKTGSSSSDLPFLLGDDESPADVSSDSDSQNASDPSQVATSSKLSAAFWNISDESGSGSSSTSSTGANSSDPSPISTAVEADSTDGSGFDITDEFLKLADMTPAERIRAQYLKAHNLSEDEFNKLPQDQQAEINKDIAKEIQQQMGAAANRKSASGSSQADDFMQM